MHSKSSSLPLLSNIYYICLALALSESFLENVNEQDAVACDPAVSSRLLMSSMKDMSIVIGLAVLLVDIPKHTLVTRTAATLAGLVEGAVSMGASCYRSVSQQRQARLPEISARQLWCGWSSVSSVCNIRNHF